MNKKQKKMLVRILAEKVLRDKPIIIDANGAGLQFRN